MVVIWPTGSDFLNLFWTFTLKIDIRQSYTIEGDYNNCT